MGVVSEWTLIVHFSSSCSSIHNTLTGAIEIKKMVDGSYGHPVAAFCNIHKACAVTAVSRFTIPVNYSNNNLLSTSPMYVLAPFSLFGPQFHCDATC